MKKNFLALAAVVSLLTASCKTAVPSSVGPSSELPPPTQTLPPESSAAPAPVFEIAGDELRDSPFLLYSGRRYFSEALKMTFFYHTASGFEVEFEGTSLTLDFYHGSSASGRTAGPIYFSAFVDGADLKEEEDYYIDESHPRIVIRIAPGRHRVKLLKRSEPAHGLVALKSAAADGQFFEPAATERSRFLLIGASGISGHGSLGRPNEAWTSKNSSSLYSFGYLSARMFDADVQFVAASGWGVTYGYNATNGGGKVNIPAAFDYVGIDDTDHIVKSPWDPQSYVPDVIVTNIGGNDFSSYINNLTDAAKKKEATLNFQSGVRDFLNKLHELYPAAKIVWTSTNENTGNGAASKSVISELDPTGKFVRTAVIQKVGSDGDPEGADGHASVYTHIKSADIIAAKLESWLKIEPTRGNISWSESDYR